MGLIAAIIFAFYTQMLQRNARKNFASINVNTGRF